MGERLEWRTIAAELARDLAGVGLDLTHPFCLAWYEDAVTPTQRLPWSRRRDALALLVGNTRAMWPRFLADLARRDEIATASDPLDRWIEEAVDSVTRSLGRAHEVVFAHEAPPRRRPMQEIAVRAGFAPLSPGHLLAHPVYGPWFAVRAVLVVDVAGPGGTAGVTAAPCAGCAAPCRVAFEHACAVADARVEPSRLHEQWEPWLAVRDACPVGTAHRYGEDQILFHYARRWPIAAGKNDGEGAG